MLKAVIVTLAVFALLAGLGVSYLMQRAGEYKILEPVAVGKCLQVTGAPGAEDIALFRRHRLAFISSDDRRGSAAEGRQQGAIFAYDLETPGSLRNLTSEFSGELHPHGISLYEGDEGVFLFVVNHTSSGHGVEIFEWSNSSLVHRESISDDLLLSPNDVLAVGPRQFYATNDHGSRGGLSRALEDYLQRPAATVVYYDGSGFEVAARGIAFANGINISNDGREIYVAATTRGRLHFFVRDLATGALEENGALDLGTGLDNITMDRYGMLWMAAHPKLMTFVSHAKDAAKHSPSEVLWVDPDQNADPPVRTVFLSLGEDLSGASVAVPWGSRLLIGSVFEPHFLDCERDPDA